jgi:phage gpG-like protein
MLNLSIRIAGEAAMARGVARFTEGLADYRPLWGAIEDDFYAAEQEQFRTEGAGMALHWTALSASYAKWKETHFPGRLILERTGDLRHSLTDRRDPNALCIEERETLTLGTNIPFAIFHQQGTSKMPARPVMPAPEDFQRRVREHIQTYLEETGKSGFPSHG